MSQPDQRDDDVARDCNGKPVPENEAPLDAAERHLGYVKESVGDLPHSTPVHRALGHLWYAMRDTLRYLRSLPPSPKSYTHTCTSNPQAVCVACEAGETKGETGELHFCDYSTGPHICKGDRCDGHTVKEMEAYDAGQANARAGTEGAKERPLYIRNGVADLMVDELAKQHQKAQCYGSLAGKWKTRAVARGAKDERLEADGVSNDAALKWAREVLENAWAQQGHTEAPPAASETAKCGYCGGPVPCGPCHDGDARPSPETVEADAGGTASAEETQAAIRMREAGLDAQADEGYRQKWYELTDGQRRAYVAAYRFVRAESETERERALHMVRGLTHERDAYKRIAELNSERVLKFEAARVPELEQQLATLKAEKEDLEQTCSKFNATLAEWMDRWRKMSDEKEAADANRAELLSELAELRGDLAQSRSERGVLMDQRERERAAKEAAEANRAEWIATNERAHALAEQLLEERNEARAKLEAAEARVRAYERVVLAAIALDDAPYEEAGIEWPALETALLEIPEDIRPQSPAPGTEGREG